MSLVKESADYKVMPILKYMQRLLNTHRNHSQTHQVPLLHTGARKHKGPDTQNALKALTPTGICTQCTNEDEEFVMKNWCLEKNTFYTGINITLIMVP